MTARKVFWIVLVIALMVWGGVGVYFWTLRTQRETRTPPRAMVPETTSPVSSPAVSLPSWAQIKPELMVATGRIKSKDINKNTITIKNSQTGKEATITWADKRLPWST